MVKVTSPEMGELRESLMKLLVIEMGLTGGNDFSQAIIEEERKGTRVETDCRGAKKGVKFAVQGSTGDKTGIQALAIFLR